MENIAIRNANTIRAIDWFIVSQLQANFLNPEQEQNEKKPGRKFRLFSIGHVAQLVEHSPEERKVVGANPTVTTIYFN